jgi:branched-chain amino acid transport system permease protein
VLVLEQALNGLQYGITLFLMAAGLTLVFGIMNLVNLAHGSLYMVGAYLATAFYAWTGSFPLAVVLALLGTLAVGVVVELVALRTLYERDHLDQVLATFGLILFFNELVAIVWGRAALYASVPTCRSCPACAIRSRARSSSWSVWSSRPSCGRW